VVRRAAIVAALSVTADALAQYEAPNASYSAPATYYNSATGTGATLKANLNAIIDGHSSFSYDAARTILPVLDRDPANSSNLLLVYSGYSVPGAWDAGVTWNREHCWPDSLGLDGTSPAYSDLFNLRPADNGVNSDRGNEYYNDIPGGGVVANTDAPLCREDSGDTMWQPRAVEKGDLARNAMYMDVRYEGDSSDTFPRNLQLVDDTSLISTSNNNFGKLSALLRWHYQDGVSNAERKRNNLIYTDYQHNRNPFVDHPEYVWSIFGVGLEGNNSSKISVGPSPAADGSSSTTVNLRTMKNGTFGTSTVALNKSGYTPTTFDINGSGAATATLVGQTAGLDTNAIGPGQAFDYNSQTRSISVSLNASTATTGLKTGTLTIDNTDLTSLGTGQGSADGNDIIQINGQVLDNRTITATAYSGKVIRSASIPVTLSSPGQDDNNYTRVTVKANASGADANGASIAAGSDVTFNNATMTAARSISGAFSSVGAKSGTLNFTVAGEGLTGESVKPVSVAYNVQAVDHSEGSFVAGADQDAASVNFDYVPQGFSRTQTVSIYNKAAASGATANLLVNAPAGSGNTSNLPLSGTVSQSNVAAGNKIDVTANVNTSTVGTFSASYTFPVSDEAIPGATSGNSLVLTTAAKVTAGAFPVSGSLKLIDPETWNPDTVAIGSSATLTTTGNGTFDIGSTQNHGANSALVINAGHVIMESDAGSAGNMPLAVQVGNVGSSNTTMQFNASQHLRSLKVFDFNRATVAAGGEKMIHVGSLSVGANARLDLNEADLIVESGSFATISNLVFQGYRDSTDTSATGIISTAGQTQLGHPILAVFDNAMLNTGSWPFGSSETVGATAIVGKYTYLGDADLNGMVTPDDYGAVDSNLGTHVGTAVESGGMNWLAGDWNLDGDITPDDYSAIDANLGLGQDNPLTAQGMAALGTAAVPEPGALGLALGAGLLGLRRRKR
jgi:endonuclease I